MVTSCCWTETSKIATEAALVSSMLVHYFLIFKFHVFDLILIIIIARAQFFLIIFKNIQISRHGILPCYNSHSHWLFRKSRRPYIKWDSMSWMKLQLITHYYLLLTKIILYNLSWWLFDALYFITWNCCLQNCIFVQFVHGMANCSGTKVFKISLTFSIAEYWTFWIWILNGLHIWR